MIEIIAIDILKLLYCLRLYKKKQNIDFIKKYNKEDKENKR